MIIFSFVKEVVTYYYSDQDVAQDPELQKWIREIFTYGFLGNAESGMLWLFNLLDESIRARVCINKQTN